MDFHVGLEFKWNSWELSSFIWHENRVKYSLLLKFHYPINKVSVYSIYAFYTVILLHITVCICELNIFSDICEHPWSDFKRVSECGVCGSKWMADWLLAKKKKKKKAVIRSSNKKRHTFHYLYPDHYWHCKCTPFKCLQESIQHPPFTLRCSHKNVWVCLQITGSWLSLNSEGPRHEGQLLL